MKQTKKPVDIPKAVEAAAMQIHRYVGGRSASSRVPIVVIGGAGPNGPVALLGKRLNGMLHMPDIRNIQTPDELADHLADSRGSYLAPMIIHCGEQIHPSTQKELETLYARHRNATPQLLIVAVGVSPEELVRHRSWRPSFGQLFAARIIDFERSLAGERRRSLDLFRGHLQRKAQMERLQVEIDHEAMVYLDEIVKVTSYVGNDSMTNIAEKAYEQARLTPSPNLRVTREHVLAALPPHLMRVLTPPAGLLVN
ncbi:MAG TPA: hypothetical protein VMT81_00350 [Candidatus Paceibacterota bacterium]|nr:hypothetical protein [Candidatus Paceibacterota bacterium]